MHNANKFRVLSSLQGNKLTVARLTPVLPCLLESPVGSSGIWGQEARGDKRVNWNDIIKFANHGNPAPPRRVEKTDEEWREILDEDRFYVTRLKGTESPFSSGLCSLFEPGLYACTCCKTELFNSGSKFDSGTGWPSFSDPVEQDIVAYHRDGTHGMDRIETTCNICDAHLGHVFPDGPAPSGLRFCINALSLDKVSKE